MAESSPTVVVLAGPNGAGKTTSARSLLAETLQLMTFVNADVIAQNFFQLYRPVVSTWRVYDNSQGGLPQLVAHGDETGSETILIHAVWQQMQEVLS